MGAMPVNMEKGKQKRGRKTVKSEATWRVSVKQTETEQHNATVIKSWSALYLFVKMILGTKLFFKSNEPSALFRFHCKHFSWLAVVSCRVFHAAGQTSGRDWSPSAETFALTCFLPSIQSPLPVLHAYIHPLDFSMFIELALWHHAAYFPTLTSDHRCPGNQNRNLDCKQMSKFVFFLKSTWPDKKDHADFFHQKTVLPGELYVSVKKRFTKSRCVCVVESTSCVVWCRKSDFPKPFWGVAMTSEQQRDSVHCLPFHNPSALLVNDLIIINRCWFEQSSSFCFTFWQNVPDISGICSPALAPCSAMW